MERLEEIYKHHCEKYSDIQEHLPTLKKYTEECNHVVEMGVRYVVSTYAFMMGKPRRLISYDILLVENFNIYRNNLKKLALDNHPHCHNVDYNEIIPKIKELLYLNNFKK